MTEITFHTLRHWKATEEYHRTRDIIHVQQLLRHKNIKSTMLYISIEQEIYQEANDEFVSKAVETTEEAQQLIDVVSNTSTQHQKTLCFSRSESDENNI